MRRRGSRLAYNGRMNRLIDKLIVLACCLAAASLLPLATATVVGAAAAVACAGAGEVAGDRTCGRLARVAGCAAWVAAALAWPEAAAFLPLAAYDAVRAVPRGGARWAAAAGAAALLVVCVRMRDAGVRAEAVLLVALFCLVSCLLSARTGAEERERARNRRVRDELQERSLSLEAKNRDLLERQDYEVRIATLAERARIAREIHDNVGHQLTRAKLQADALAIVHAGDVDAARGFSDVSRTVDEALSMVRSSVHALRDESVDLGAQMRGVAEAAARDSGISVTVEAGVEEVPANVASCLVAVLREAVSNALRHGSGVTRVEARCLEHPSMWQLVVLNDGDVAQARMGSDGMGLASMRERVEALGGRFLAGPQDGGGWRVFASVPRKGAGTTAGGEAEGRVAGSSGMGGDGIEEDA